MNSTDTPSPSDHDEYWKDAFDAFLPELLAILAPDVAAAIDWPRGVESIPHGFFPDALESNIGARYPDRVYRVFLRDGDSAVLFLHFEFEAGRKNDFAARVMVYRMRLALKLDQPIFTLAFLLDGDPNHRPTEYVEKVFSNTLRFEFNTVKLLDFADHEDEWLESGNPGKVLIAIKLIDLRLKDPDERLAAKRRALRKLAEKMRKDPVFRALTRFLIQGIMVSRLRDREFHEEVLKLEQEHHMPFVTVYEKEAEARGEARAALRTKHDALEKVLRARFPDNIERQIERIGAIEDLSILDDLLVRAAIAKDLAEFDAALP